MFLVDVPSRERVVPASHRLIAVPSPFLDRNRSRAGFAEIARHVAGGESSYARLRAGQELVLMEARGATIRDLDGNSWSTFMGYGVNLFGHAPGFVWEAVEETVAELGWHIAFPHRLAGVAAELVAELVPGIEQLRFANSGTGATPGGCSARPRRHRPRARDQVRGALPRVGRSPRGGHGPGSAARPARPDSAGIPSGVMASLWTVPWNDADALAEAVAAAGDGIAAVICEVVPGSGACSSRGPATSSNSSP